MLAAAVSMSTAASHKLAAEASSLNDLLGQFRLEDETTARAVLQTTPAQPKTSDVRALDRRIAGGVRGGATATAVALQTDEAGWEEF